MRLLFIPIAAAALTGCQPRVDVEAIAGRTFLLTNRGDRDLAIGRIVANDQPGRAECEQAPGVTIGPGRSHTVTFFDCGVVTRLALETDRGTVRLAVGE